MKKKLAAGAFVVAAIIGGTAPSAFAAHRYNVTTGTGECQQLGGKSVAGTSDTGLDTAEEKGNGRIQGGLCPTN